MQFLYLSDHHCDAIKVIKSRWPHIWNWLPMGESALAVSFIFCFLLKQNIVLPFVIKVLFFRQWIKQNKPIIIKMPCFVHLVWLNGPLLKDITVTFSNTCNRWSMKYCSIWPKIMYILLSVDAFMIEFLWNSFMQRETFVHLNQQLNHSHLALKTWALVTSWLVHIYF